MTDTARRNMAARAGTPSRADGGFAGMKADDSTAAEPNAARHGPWFTDHEDGTVTDRRTGLTWLRNTDTFGKRTWAGAVTDCGTLAHGMHGLTDGSAAGDWRLPGIEELNRLITGLPSRPAMPDAAVTGRWQEGTPFTGTQTTYYWSGTPHASHACVAWLVLPGVGIVLYDEKTGRYGVWPVRNRTRG